MKSMLNVLENIYASKTENEKLSYHSLTNSLLQGIKPKIYKPLMERQRCGKLLEAFKIQFMYTTILFTEGLEDRIQHFIKKRRLIVTEDEQKSSSRMEEMEES